MTCYSNRARRIARTGTYFFGLRGDGLLGLYALVEPFVRRELRGATVVVVAGRALPGLGARPAVTAEQSREDARRFFCGKKQKPLNGPVRNSSCPPPFVDPNNRSRLHVPAK